MKIRGATGKAANKSFANKFSKPLINKLRIALIPHNINNAFVNIFVSTFWNIDILKSVSVKII